MADKYFEVHNIPRPILPKKKQEAIVTEVTEAVVSKPEKKKVTFDIDDDHEGDWQ